MSNVVEHTAKRWHLRFNFGLPAALGIAIFMAGLIVGIAYLMYMSDSNQKFDIARPGKNPENEALNVQDEDTDTTSPVEGPAVQRKLDFLNKEVNALNGINSYNPNDLNDQNVQLLPGEPGI